MFSVRGVFLVCPRSKPRRKEDERRPFRHACRDERGFELSFRLRFVLRFLLRQNASPNGAQAVHDSRCLHFIVIFMWIFIARLFFRNASLFWNRDVARHLPGFAVFAYDFGCICSASGSPSDFSSGKRPHRRTSKMGSFCLANMDLCFDYWCDGLLDVILETRIKRNRHNSCFVDIDNRQSDTNLRQRLFGSFQQIGSHFVDPVILPLAV